MSGECPWSGFAPATIHFCERELCAWVTQPANTWTNIGFVLVGLHLLRRARLLPEERVLGRLFGVSSIVLGIGSGLFHASGTFAFEVLDLLGMFLISGLMLVLNLRRWRGWGARRIYATYVGLVAASVALLLAWRPGGIAIFTAQVTLAMLVEIAQRFRGERAEVRFFFGLVVTFSISLAVWALDLKGIVCDPDNHWLSGHGVWHLLNAAAISFLYMFHRQFGPPGTTSTPNELRPRSRAC